MTGWLCCFLVALGFSAADDSTNEAKFWENWVPRSEYSFFPTLPIAAPLSQDEKCREDSRRLIMHLKNETLWAMQMWDSSATATFGVLHGNKYQLGNYDECLAVTQPIRSQYCHAIITATVHNKEAFEGDVYEINPDPNATVWRKFQNSHIDQTQYSRDVSQWGLCVPASCNSTEMEKAINLYLGSLNERLVKENRTTYQVEIPAEYCSDGSEDQFSYGEIGFWVFTWVVLIVVVIATSMDLAKKKELVNEESKLKGYLMKFSLKRNVLTMMDRDEGGGEVETRIIYGIRFYNVCYIVTDHGMGALIASTVLNSQKFEEDFRTWLSVILPHGDLLVDTYFFIGGYLAALNLLNIYKRNFYNPIRVILHRFFRAGRLLTSFSIKRNVKKLMEDEDFPEISHLKCLHGLKYFSMALIVLDHHIVFFIYLLMMHSSQNIEEFLRSSQNIFLPHGDLLVDSFFFVSGFLGTYMLFSSLEKRRFNVLLAIPYRFIRLAPLYFYIIWFHATALVRFGSGPVWKIGVQHEVEYCRENWWASVLFVQNYVNAKEMCMIHAWYLPCDFHFFIVSVFLIILIQKNKKVGSCALYILTIVAIIIPGISTYSLELYPLLSFKPKLVSNVRTDPSFEYLYIKSHARAAVYLLGTLTAYHLYENRNSTWKMTKRTSVLICFLGLGLLFAPMLYGSLYFNPRRPYNLTESVIFSMLRRVSWGLGWVLFMVVNKFGVIPIFGKLFSWRISVALSKLTYGVYLIHFILQLANQSKAKIPHQFIAFEMFYQGTNDLFFATGYAVILYLVIELPFRLVFKELLFPKPKKEVKPLPEGNQLPTKLSPPQLFSDKP